MKIYDTFTSPCLMIFGAKAGYFGSRLGVGGSPVPRTTHLWASNGR